MIDAASATNAAVEFLKSVLPSASRVRLEELEVPEDRPGSRWRVTLSFVDRSEPSNFFLAAQPGAARLFKTFEIDVESGNVLKMNIRKLD
jgi:hypothetical protein